MTASFVHCAHCGKSNSSHCIWCARCQASLPSTEMPPDTPTVTQEDAERRELYRSVLDDLGQLVYAGRADASAAETVGGFYRTQLATIETRERERARIVEVRDRIKRIRDMAQRGRYQQALDELQIAARQFPESSVLEPIAAEVQVRLTREEATRLAEEAQKRALETVVREEESVEKADESEQRHAVSSPAGESKPDTSMSTEPDLPAEPVPSEPLVAHAEGAFEKPGEPMEASDEVVVAQLVEAPTDSVMSADPVLASTAGPIETLDDTTSDSLEVAASQASTQMAAGANEAKTDAVVANRTETAARSFEKFPETPTPTQRLIDAASQWSSLLKPFLIDNVGWFVGGFLLIAGFVVLIVTFWTSIEQNRVLMHSLVYLSLAGTTGILFSMAYYMRVRYPQLESSSTVLLVLVSLLIPLVFAAAVLTMLIPASPVDAAVSAMLR